MGTFHIWLEATRPKTLPAAVAPVLLGSGLAYAEGAFVFLAALICLVFALLVQVGTNFANDYLDGIRGTDTEQRIGPPRAVASGLVAPELMKRVTMVTLAVAFCVGLALIPFGGWWLLLIGCSSVLCAWLYTGGPYPLAYNGLGDVFVVLFFGWIAVGCTYYVQVGRLSLDACLLGLGCGLLVNNILVVNNYRDVDEDRIAN
jgi:1,4-dihydroxy-2-naphthoate octaprenyltransferase